MPEDFQFDLPGEEGETSSNQQQTRTETRQESRRDSVKEEVTLRGLNLAAISTTQHRTSIGGISDTAMQTISKVFDAARDHESSGLPEEIKRNKFKFLPMMGNGASQNPALIIALNAKSIERTLVYVLMFEQPGATLQTRMLSEGRETYESLVLMEDQLNDRFIERVAALVGCDVSRLVLVNHQIVLAEYTEILSRGEEHDAVTTNLVASIVNNAIDAICGTRESLIGDQDLNTELTPESVSGGVRMEVNYDYPTTPERDGGGAPVAADVVARTYFTVPNPDDREINDRLAFGSTMVSLNLYLDMSSEGSRSVFGRRNSEPTPTWQAVLDVRGLIGAPGVPYSLTQALYQLAHVAPLTNGGRWTRALTPRNVIAGTNGVIEKLLDLGVLNIFNQDEAIASYTENLTANTPESELTDYFEMNIREDVSVGLTLPLSNDKSWVLSLFEAMATTKDQDYRRKLVQKLYKACNVLTGNRFLEVIAGTRLAERDYCPFQSTGVRELIGVWTDDNGNLRSLAEWDVVAYASRVARRPNGQQLVFDYQATFEPIDGGRSTDKMLSQRLEILRRDCASNIRVQGSAEKLAIDLNWLRALCDALTDTTLEPTLSNVDGLQRRQRVGQTIYRSMAGRDIGYNGRQTRGGTSDRTRSAYNRYRSF